MSQINPVNIPIIFKWSFLILFTHTCLGPLIRLLSSDFPIKTLWTFAFSKTRHMLRLPHLLRFGYSYSIWCGIHILKLVNIQFPLSSSYASPLWPKCWYHHPAVEQRHRVWGQPIENIQTRSLHRDIDGKILLTCIFKEVGWDVTDWIHASAVQSPVVMLISFRLTKGEELPDNWAAIANFSKTRSWS